MVQVSHISSFKGYKFGICPDCNKRSVYTYGVVTGKDSQGITTAYFTRCRSCSWSILDHDLANLAVTIAFYQLGDWLRVL